VALVNERFPKLTRRAKIQVQMTDDFQALQEAIIFICSTQDAAEVAKILDNLDEEQ